MFIVISNNHIIWPLYIRSRTMHLVNLSERLHRKYYLPNSKHEARTFVLCAQGLNQCGWYLAPNSSMISARVHVGLTYYLRRIGRCAVPLSPLIETIVCRSAVDSRSGVEPFRPSFSSLRAKRACCDTQMQRNRHSAFPPLHIDWSMISMKRGGRALLFVVAAQKKNVEKALYRMSYKLRNKHWQSFRCIACEEGRQIFYPDASVAYKFITERCLHLHLKARW